jgi:hypothetical protein
LDQQIFSALLLQHILKLSRYFWLTNWRVQVSAPNKAVLQNIFGTKPNIIEKYHIKFSLRRFIFSWAPATTWYYHWRNVLWNFNGQIFYFVR